MYNIYLKTFIKKRLDFQKFFTKSEFEKIPHYLELIKRPIDLEMMKEKASSGLYDQNTYNTLLEDFYLLVENALEFNAHHHEVYKEATKLKLLGRVCFDFFKEELNIEEVWLLQNVGKNQILEKQDEFIEYIYTHFLDIVFRAGKDDAYLTNVIVSRKQKMVEEDELKQNSVYNYN